MQSSESGSSNIRTKLFRPPVVADHLVRKRVEGQFREFGEHQIVAVTAPAGYGKSSLISRWVELEQLPCAWLSLDKSENDPNAFLALLAEALESWCAVAADGLKRAYQSSIKSSASDIAMIISTSIADQNEDGVIVLDDYHQITDEQVHQQVGALLECLPANLKVAIISRRPPPLALGRMRAQNLVLDIRLKDLRFDQDLTRAFVESSVGRPVDEAVIEKIHSLTEGWPVGLRMLLLAAKGNDDVIATLESFDGNIWQIQEYLVEEVLAQLTPEQTKGVISLAIPQRVCADLCDALDEGGEEGSQPVASALDEVLSRNLFCIPLDAAGMWFRFHHLFRDLLLDRARSTFSNDQMVELHARAAKWFDKHGFVEDAVDHSLAAGDGARAATIAYRHGVKMASHLEWSRLHLLLDTMPKKVFDTDIGLMLLLARATDKLGRVVQFLELVDKAEARYADLQSRGEEDDELLGQICALKGINVYYAGDGEEGLTLARKAVELLPAEHVFDIGLAKMTEGLALQMLGETESAKSALSRSLEGSDVLSTGTQVREAMCMVHWIGGELRELAQVAETLLEAGHSHGFDESIAHAQWLLAAAKYQLNDLDGAEQASSGLADDRFARFIAPRVMASSVHVRVHLARQDFDKALIEAESLVRDCLNATSTFYLPYARALQALTAHAVGHTAEALQWAVELDANPPAAGIMYTVPEMVAARILIASDSEAHWDKAGRLLADYTEFHRESHSKRYLIETLVLSALLCNKRGDRDAAISHLAEAVSLAEPCGFIRLFVDQGDEIIPLFNRLDVKGRQLEFVGRVLAAFRTKESDEQEEAVTNGERTPRNIAALPEQLTKREYQVLQLLAQHLTNKEIGEKLFISPATVKRHAHNIYEKLNVSDRREAITKSAGLGLISD